MDEDDAPGNSRTLPVRRNFVFDATAALGTGLFTALVINFLPAIARREGASSLVLAAIAATPFAANTLTIFCGGFIPRHNHARFIGTLIGLGRFAFVFALATTDPWWLVGMAFVAWFAIAVGSPLQVDVWRQMYPERLRARLLGYVRGLQTGSAALAAPLAGWLMDRFGQGSLLGTGAVLGLIGAAAYTRIRVPEGPPGQRFTPTASLRVLRDTTYWRLTIAWVVWGAGMFMASPLYALVLIDRFQASYAEIGVLNLATAAAGLVVYALLGRQVDRRGGALPMAAGFFLMVLAPVTYALAPNLLILALAFVLIGVGNSAIDLGWPSVLVRMVADEDRPRYLAAQSSVTGVRGAIAPFVGSFLATTAIGVNGALLLGSLIGLAGAVLMVATLQPGLRPSRVPRRLGLARR